MPISSSTKFDHFILNFVEENMWQQNNKDNKDIEEELQIRFTGYLIQAVKRTQRDYLMSLYKYGSQEVLTEEVCTFGQTLEQEVMEQLPFWETIENRALLYALKQLSERERYILLGRVLDETPFDVLGAKTGLSYKGVAAVYYRAIKKVRRIIKEVNDRDL